MPTIEPTSVFVSINNDAVKEHNTERAILKLL